MVHTGEPAYSMVRTGFDIAIKKLGVLGVTVKIIPPDVTLPDEFEVKDVINVESGETVASEQTEKPSEAGEENVKTDGAKKTRSKSSGNLSSNC